jgi:hypothetical protein
MPHLQVFYFIRIFIFIFVFTCTQQTIVRLDPPQRMCAEKACDEALSY